MKFQVILIVILSFMSKEFLLFCAAKYNRDIYLIILYVFISNFLFVYL